MRSERTTRPARGAGFSLLENLMAAAVLGVIVLAIGMAVSAAQKSSLEGQKMILASMAADDMLSELRSLPYADLPTYNGLNQPVGALVTLAGDVYPTTYWAIGRSVIVQDTQRQVQGIGALINGRRIVVSSFDDARILVQLETFVPEPAP